MQSTTTADARAEKAREQRARRRAERLDLGITKSRRDGSYMIFDVWTNVVVAGGSGPIGCEYGMWLDDVEAALDE